MTQVIAEVMFSPLGTETPSLSKYIVAAMDILKDHPEVKYQLHPMGTVLEGERRDIIELVELMNEAIFAAGVQRVGTTLKIDERRDKPASMQHKVDIVVEGMEAGK